MNTEIVKVEYVKPVILPMGIYEGVWSGYVITINNGDGEWHLKTKDGIRGSVTVTVTSNESGISVVR